jgi:hypothetical protein
MLSLEFIHLKLNVNTQFNIKENASRACYFDL